MRLRHVLSTCAALPLLATTIHPAAAKTTSQARAKAGAVSTMTPAEMAGVRASVLRMVDHIKLPYQQFTLANGLRVIVHSDRSTPIVHVGIWYDVGSKHEPAGRSGFAHLFEHLMFNGSENVPGDYLSLLMSAGGEVNGNTSVDRTHYYEVVPTGALDRALFMESDRMGHLLGALSQASLDEQRGIVQNEKRQASNSPTAIIGDLQRAALYPKTHPYGHSLLGSMKDLNAATPDDVRAFFKAHYGPNNALLVLAGDVDMETARRLVIKYFGDIPAGPRNVRPEGGPMSLVRTVNENTTAPIEDPMIVRAWSVPGAESEDALTLKALSVAMSGSALQTSLVGARKPFQSLSIRHNSDNAQAGEFSITGTLRPGIDPELASAALDRQLARFLKQGASAERLTEWLASSSYSTVNGLEVLTFRTAQLGEHAIRNDDPAAVKRELRFYANLTPAMVTAAGRKWLGRPYWQLTVTPGPRVTPEDDAGIDGSATGTTMTAVPDAAPASSTPPAQSTARKGDRGPLPDVGATGDPRFPTIEHAKLANGIPVIYARWDSTPFTYIGLSINGSGLNEPADQEGTLSTMYTLLAKSFGGMTEDVVSKRLSLTGTSLLSSTGWESGNVILQASDANLGMALTIMHQALTTPAFPAAAIESMKKAKLEERSDQRRSPAALIDQEMLPLLDAGSPYNRLRMYGDGTAFQRITRKNILAAYHRWVRPEHAKMTIVSDKPLGELLPMLNRSIGGWKMPGPAQPVPPVTYHPKPGTPQIVLIDMPEVVQASIRGGQWVPANTPSEALDLASSVLGSGFTSRLNMNLREDKHWTYVAGGSFEFQPYGSAYTFSAEVQQDKTGPAIAEVMKEMRDIVGDRPITADEFDHAKTARLGLLPRFMASRSDIAGALEDVQAHDRPDDYPAKAGARLRAVTLADANAALRQQLDPSRWSWVIVGNAAIIRPQLDRLGLPVRLVKAADVLPPL